MGINVIFIIPVVLLLEPGSRLHIIKKLPFFYRFLRVYNWNKKSNSCSPNSSFHCTVLIEQLSHLLHGLAIYKTCLINEYQSNCCRCKWVKRKIYQCATKCTPTGVQIGRRSCMFLSECVNQGKFISKHEHFPNMKTVCIRAP